MTLSTLIVRSGGISLAIDPLPIRRPKSLLGAYEVRQVGPDQARLMVAVPGFGGDDLSISARPGELVVSGCRSGGDESVGADTRLFERRFALGRFTEVSGARLENGLLTIELSRAMPEALRPRVIPINAHRPGVAWRDLWRRLRGALDRFVGRLGAPSPRHA